MNALIDAPAGYFWSVCALLLAISLFALLRYATALSAWLTMRSVQTSRTRSASQGYTELQGRAQRMPGEPIIAPLTRQDCVWYDYRVNGFPKDARSWFGIERGVSDAIFWIEDSNERSIVDPEGAQIFTHRHVVWYGDTQRPEIGPFGRIYDWFGRLHRRVQYRERHILPGDRLYILGEFETLARIEARNDEQETASLMRSWKSDPVKMADFDTNGDQRVDAEEWEAAREQAVQTVQAQKLLNPGPRPQHLIKKPKNPRMPFIIATGDEATVRNQFRNQALAMAMLFMAGLAILAWLLSQRF